MDIDKKKLVSYIKKLNTPKVLVVGDMALDEMIYGDAERISREAPVLILQHTHTKLILGGASNAAHNIAALNNGKVSVCGVCGDDYQAGQLFEAFELANIDCSRLIKDKTRKTTTKTRISGAISTSITQQIVRVDRQTNAPISDETEEKLIGRIEKMLPNFDAVVLSDYHIGTLTENVIKTTIELANKYNKIIVVDAQKNLENYKNVTSMTPNLPDTQKSAGFTIENIEDLKKAGDYLLSKTNAKSILLGAPNPQIAIKGDTTNAAIVVDISKNILYHYNEDGEAICAYLVASGKEKYPTDTGVRIVTHVEKYPYKSAPASTRPSTRSS